MENNTEYQFQMLFESNVSLITRARNDMVAYYLALSPCEYFMFIDSDIGFDYRDIIKMVKTQKKIIGATYPKKMMNWNTIYQFANLNVAKTEPELESMSYSYAHSFGDKSKSNRDAFEKGTEGKFKGIFEVNYMPTGFLLIHRSVLLEMIKYYPDLRYKVANHRWDDRVKDGYAFFTDMIIDDGDYISEDFGFCHKWKKVDKNNKIYLYSDINLVHNGVHNYSGNYKVKVDGLKKYLKVIDERKNGKK